MRQASSARSPAFTLIEVIVVVAIASVMAAIVIPSISAARASQAREEGMTLAEGQINSARDVARSELRCVTVGKNVTGTTMAIVGTVHPCLNTDLYASGYTNGIPNNAERELFRVQLDAEVFKDFQITEQLCAPQADCPRVRYHGFGDIFEFRTDGSTDATYVLRIILIDGTEQLWDVHAATGTVRRRA
jgi:prepilin-type N-terminal cleavage/methylation domain-containing protein